MNFIINNEEIKLINLVKNGDDKSLQELIDKHSGICIDTCKKYINIPSVSGFVSDEISSSKNYIIYNSAISYDPSKGSKFSTWLCNQARFFCLNSINKYSKLIPIENEKLFSLIESNNDNNFKFKKINEEKIRTIEIVKNTLSELSNKKIKKCIEEKYFCNEDKGKTFTQIAKEMNVTVQTVINWHNKFIKLIKNKIEQEKIFDKS